VDSKVIPHYIHRGEDSHLLSISTPRIVSRRQWPSATKRKNEVVFISDLLAIVTTSEKRKNLLILLLSGPRLWQEIKEQLNVTASGMLPQIKILETAGLVVKDGHQFQLTDSGQIVAFHLEQFTRTLTVIDQQKKYWLEHDIRGLPEEFFLRLGELKKIEINEAGTEESSEPYARSLETILQSKKISGITPIAHPVFPKIFNTLAQDGREVNLILSKNAFEKIRKDCYNLIFEALEHENAHLSVYDNAMKFSSIVTEKNISVELFTKNGLYDSKRDLISNDPMALKWGEEIFSYFSERSHSVRKDGSY
jgi:predicted transcriptional regulator